MIISSYYPKILYIDSVTLTLPSYQSTPIEGSSNVRHMNTSPYELSIVDGSKFSSSGIARRYGHSNIYSSSQVYNSVSFCCFHYMVLCVFENPAANRRTTAPNQQQNHKQLGSNDENNNPSRAPPAGSENTAKLSREIAKEATNWLTRFIEKASEKGMKKCKARVL
ncbi:hypothetical protein Bca101_020900 [Brassica carinata]